MFVLLTIFVCLALYFGVGAVASTLMVKPLTTKHTQTAFEVKGGQVDCNRANHKKYNIPWYYQSLEECYPTTKTHHVQIEDGGDFCNTDKIRSELKKILFGWPIVLPYSLINFHWSNAISKYDPETARIQQRKIAALEAALDMKSELR